MKSLIFGGLCCASFALSALANLAGQSHWVENQNPKDGTVHNLVVGQDQATVLIAVTSKTCNPCKRLKAETLPPLQEQGYRVKDVDYTEWDRTKVDKVPLLVYLNDKDEIVFMEVGFRTVDQVKQRLTKP